VSSITLIQRGCPDLVAAAADQMITVLTGDVADTRPAGRVADFWDTPMSGSITLYLV